MSHCEYTAVELEAGFGAAAFARHCNWAKQHNCQIDQAKNDHWTLYAGDDRIDINWIQGDALQANKAFSAGSFDLIIGHAVIDLLPVPSCMPDLLCCLRKEGGFYFSLN